MFGKKFANYYDLATMYLVYMLAFTISHHCTLPVRLLYTLKQNTKPPLTTNKNKASTHSHPATCHHCHQIGKIFSILLFKWSYTVPFMHNYLYTGLRVP